MARGVRRELPDPGLPRRGSDHGLGPVSRQLAGAGIRRSRDRGRTLAHRRLLPLLRADALVHGARQDKARAREGDGMRRSRKLVALFALFIAAVAGAAAASGGADIRMEPSPINRLSLESQ